MTIYNKPLVLPAWAEAGDRTQPSNGEIQTGWPAGNTPPSRQRMNWLQNYNMNGIRYLTQRGLPQWDSAEEYPVNAIIMASNGQTYRCVNQNTNNEPSVSPGSWAVWPPAPITEVGTVSAFARTTAPSGWLKANGTTIGNAASGGTQFASADAAALFTVLWDNFTNTVLPIQDATGAASSRGVSAAADFAANKRMPLPDLRAEFVRGLDDGRGVDTGRALGSAQADAFKVHTHGLGYTPDSGDEGATAGQAGLSPYISSTPSVVTDEGGTETRPRNIALLYCIKY